MSSRLLQQLRREQRVTDSPNLQQLFYLLETGNVHLRLQLVVARE